MPLDKNLLSPIAGANPSGENLRYVPIYDKIKEARRKEDVIAQGDWGRPLKEADYRLVIKLATEALSTKGKDLQVAAWLTEALVHEHGLRGLLDGLGLLHGMLENFWDTVYPEPEDGDFEMRAGPLSWVGDYRDVEMAVHQIGLTTGGLDWFKYKESRTVGYETDVSESASKLEARNQAIAEGKLTAEEFDKDLTATPKADFEARLSESEETLEEIQRLNALCEEKFGDSAPSFRRLRTAVEDIEHVIRMLLVRKREQEPDVVEEPQPEPAREDTAVETMSGERGPAASLPGTQPASKPARGKSLSQEPVDRDDAIGRVIGVAQYLRAQNPSDPVPYLILRSLRWGELRAQGQPLGPEMLEAPPTEVRQQLRKFAMEGEWAQVLETTEKAMGAPYGRAWLDLQRYSVKACKEMGGSSELVASAICDELKALLSQFPELPTMSLIDDTPVANAETQAWLRELTEPPASKNEPLPPPVVVSIANPPDEANASVVERDAYELALEALRSQGPEEAIRLLTREIAHERSGRGRFLRRLQLAQICVTSNRETIAHAILDELAREIEVRKLDEWELPETIAQTLALLFRCMDETDAGSKRKVYAQICRLDPLQAARLAG